MLCLKHPQFQQGPFYIKANFDTSMQLETRCIAKTTI